MPGAVRLDDPGRFINRELSWLDFGARLLDLVADDRLPLLERVKFLAIFAEGLDEFFQVRVAGLEDQVAAGLRTRVARRDEPARAAGRHHRPGHRAGRRATAAPSPTRSDRR